MSSGGFEVSFSATEARLMSGASLRFHGRVRAAPGEVWLLVGENASGKTTFLSLLESIMMGSPQGIIHRYDATSVTVNAQCRPVGCVFQEPRENFISASSSDDLILPLMNGSQTAEDSLEYIHDIADAIDPKKRRVFERNIDRLSSGEQQKLALAACLAPRPALMLWDEALSRVDEPSALELMELMKRLQGDTIIIAATHREARDRMLFGQEFTGMIRISRTGENVYIEQREIGALSRSDVIRTPFRFPKLLADRVGSRISEDCARKLFKNGFRVFQERSSAVIELKDFELRVAGNLLAGPQHIRVSDGLNVVIGSNGSGKTLFLRTLAGEVALDPWWVRRSKVVASAESASFLLGSPSSLRKSGRSVYLPAEPYKWLTDEFVADELQRYLAQDEQLERRTLLAEIRVSPEQTVNSLSYGQRKFLCLVSLPNELELICLDEPFADLSPDAAEASAGFINFQIESGRWRSVVIAQCNDTKALTDELS